MPEPVGVQNLANLAQAFKMGVIMTSDSLRFMTVSGRAVAPHVEALASLRVRVFREFPYLYEGEDAYERDYLQVYVNSPRSILTLAFDGDRAVGATTALPLTDEHEEMQQPFVERGYDIARVFYLGESVLLPEYRGQGVGVKFFEAREKHARALGGFDLAAFCAVDRPENHPRRPAGYQPLNDFWTKRGYTRHPELKTAFSWKDLDEPEASPKPMTFWCKPLR